jgi:hypothetical protein
MPGWLAARSCPAATARPGRPAARRPQRREPEYDRRWQPAHHRAGSGYEWQASASAWLRCAGLFADWPGPDLSQQAAAKGASAGQQGWGGAVPSPHEMTPGDGHPVMPCVPRAYDAAGMLYRSVTLVT